MDGNRKRIFFIDFIKALSIIMVIITHSNITGIIRNKYLFQFTIDMAVPFFIIITGYTYTMSLENKKINSTKEWFRFENFSHKLIRLVPAFVFALLIEIIYAIHLGYDLKRIAVDIIKTGAYGQGGYYFWILLQILIVFPFMINLLKKDYISGTITIISIHLLSELLIHHFNVNILIYRLLFVRYIIFIWLGITLFYYKDKIKLRHVWLPAFWSFLFIYSISFLGYQVRLFTYWTGTSLPTAFYPFLFIFLLQKIDNLKINKKVENIIVIIGRASYHVYLVQMVYYFSPISNTLITKIGLLKAISINIIICIVIGVMYYALENIILYRIKNIRYSN
ncbi:acyltransferase family protein [Clostridium beijerinckii]|uniref:Acyltransferase n=1 Tax=Clostridium beijerinckii TaxID=1520 RepID=A0AAW3W8V4_CLOBE|nr:acyltransferase family protein [Clostridium beijerinckii]MBC2456119.1 acyltransferase [Clostridium beijerinckii]MBC2475404.1 acyltransferase [Clostridium beijerinckii]NOV63487.1 fucose 4-O-acetylase-like acetyltransferase [Clostridium beijerinckii]NOV69547.1 fucose 4-O-acetylase-like acetyltransferase [Clostridium beijerinckii]NOW31544.1 fucose 4-O-acetylase-like acetyltransferase [Clostridium beijerinckii]